jgi:dTDP-glucose 4,6-dehydratase
VSDDLRAPRRLLITGGAGFIGSTVVRAQLARPDAHVLTLDKLTYAGHTASLRGLPEGRHTFVHGDICDRPLLDRLFAEFQPDAVIHLAAETHVDRSVDDPAAFVQTNLVGTFTLLEAARAAWADRDDVLFHHVSTDEVFGSLGPAGRFDLDTRYDPSSAYSATKAGSDHLVTAWCRTYGLPVTTSNCTNNYGPRQFPEKLVPLTIRRALRGEPLPIYGDGSHERDWLHVEDHAAAIDVVLRRGLPGSTYLVSSETERSNLELVRSICGVLQGRRPRPGGYEPLITHVPDRPGHDQRYAMDSSSTTELGWTGARPLEDGLRQTVDWYLDHEDWVDEVLSDSGYDTQRLGLNPRH